MKKVMEIQIYRTHIPTCIIFFVVKSQCQRIKTICEELGVSIGYIIQQQKNISQSLLHTCHAFIKPLLNTVMFTSVDFTDIPQ